MSVRRVLVTGSNRGIGLALTRHLLQRGDRVFATARTPETAHELHTLAQRYPRTLTILPLDVEDEASIRQAAQEVSKHVDGLDWLINNAGIMYEGEHITNLSGEHLVHAFRVNSIGPMLMVKHFLPLLRRGQQPKICQMTSIMGSISLTEGGGYYSYRASKAALNMLSKILSYEVRGWGITVIIMHPGWVRTRMGGMAAPLSPDESAQGIIRVLDTTTLADTGRYLTWDGKELPW